MSASSVLRDSGRTEELADELVACSSQGKTPNVAEYGAHRPEMASANLEASPSWAGVERPADGTASSGW